MCLRASLLLAIDPFEARQRGHLQCGSKRSHDTCKKQLQNEDDHDGYVGPPVQLTRLVSCFLTVKHDFGVVTSVDRHADEALRVLEAAAAQDKVVGVNCNIFSLDG